MKSMEQKNLINKYVESNIRMEIEVKYTKKNVNVSLTSTALLEG